MRGVSFVRRIAWTIVLLSACRGQGGSLGRDAGQDGGVLGGLPDAHVVHAGDAGIEDVASVPTLDRVQPNTGSEAGGTRVAMRGTGFVDPARVFFDGVEVLEPVVLDRQTIAVTAPPHAPGWVDVAVKTPGGTASLPRAYRYHRELLLSAIAPARIPQTGGATLTITGKGFDGDTIVLLDRQPLRGEQLIDSEHIRGYAPALRPGRPEVFLFHKDAEIKRSDLLVVYGVPRPRALVPGYGPTTATSAQAVTGAGFEGAERVRIAGAVAADLTLISGATLSIDAPALAEGVYDVTVENQDTSGTLVGGYIAVDPSRSGLSVVGFQPAAASSLPGQSLTIVGHGLIAGSRVQIDGVDVHVSAINSPQVIVATIPAGLSVGAHAVQVRSSGFTAHAPSNLRIYDPIVVTSISPASGPVAGGTAVTIGGSGFVPGATVRIGGVPLANVEIASPTRITGTTIGGASGPQDVAIESADTRGVLVGAFHFIEDFELVRIDPFEGSIAGNTYVSLLGRGFDSPVSVTFGSAAATSVRLENGSILGARTASASPGTVDVGADIGSNHVTLPGAYTFYDPTLITGGAWGGPIDGSVNVSVLRLQGGMGVPVPEMFVQLGFQADPRYSAITDERGLATISAPEISGFQTVTVGQNQFEFVTFMDLESRNVTIFTSKYPNPNPPPGPVYPCPPPVAPPIVTGNVYLFKSAIDPVTHPGYVPVALVTYSMLDAFTFNPGDPPPPFPPQQAQVTADGGRYAISVLREGTVAVYAILGAFNPHTQDFIPERMGIARQVVSRVNHVTSSVAIALDIDMNQTLDVRLADPPLQIPGPSRNAIESLLDLGSDGVIILSVTGTTTDQLTLQHMPFIDASSFIYFGGSFTNVMDTGLLQPPFSVALIQGGEPFGQGLDFGPFVQMPENFDPKPDGLVHGGRLSWTQGGVRPDLTVINIWDIGLFTGFCCEDDNQDGVCEPGEMIFGNEMSQYFNRWSIYGRGGLEAYVMPRMPYPLEAFDMNMYACQVQQAVAPRFDYREFVFYNQFTNYFWESWSMWASYIVPKQE
jgi:hypothetical protein